MIHLSKMREDHIKFTSELARYVDTDSEQRCGSGSVSFRSLDPDPEFLVCGLQLRHFPFCMKKTGERADIISPSPPKKTRRPQCTIGIYRSPVYSDYSTTYVPEYENILFRYSNEVTTTYKETPRTDAENKGALVLSKVMEQ